jgi:amino acid adenylation domain-containing protein
MALHFQSLLRCIVEDPDRSITALELMSAAERRQILFQWNDTRAEYPGDSCIHHLFEAQADRTPDAVALEYGGEKLTYRELDRRANRLAEHLQNLGVGPEKLAGVMMERSPSMVASLLAIFKTGGAYVALDPAYPRERLAFMIQDARPRVLLTERTLADEFAGQVERIVRLDEFPFGEGKADGNVVVGATPDHTAYVIYTSGSTGKPKGVVGLHRGAVNRFNWMWRRYPFSPGEKICQKTSLGFVDSLWEIFGGLLQGVPAVILPDAVAKDPELLVRRLRRHRVTRIVLVPSLLRAMVDTCAPLLGRLGDLKFCVSSGESLPAELAARFRSLLPGCRLINLYGASEVAGDVTCYEVCAEESGPTVPIGRPIDNTQIYLLDPRLQPVPRGARGEIYIGGDSLARGYLRRAQLTAEKFMANPFDPTKASRLYRTGDLARFRCDGNLEFLGRADDQIKIRGWRVEPAEIEAVLNGHPAVAQSAVALRINEPAEATPGREKSENRDSASDQQLMAYVVPRDRRPSPDELRALLKRRLPEPMIPIAFIFLDSLPLLPSGKVDRRRLPLRDSSIASPRRESAAPGTEMERVVAAAWEAVLKVETVAREDNFFELGGHSLLGAQVVARLRQALRQPITLRDLFLAPTVGGLAARIERTIGADQEDLPPIAPAPPAHLKPLSPAQQPLFLFAQLFGGGDFLNLPYAYRLGGPLDVAALRDSIQEIVRRHETLRSYFVESADGPARRVRRSVKMGLPLVDLSGYPLARRRRVFEQISRSDAARCFDIEKAPLLRLKLIRFAPQKHVLLLTLHHLVCDQWSLGIFRRELAALYGAFSKNLPSPLAEPPVQFSDVVCWQQKLMAQGLLDGQIEYWRRQLARRPAPLRFRGGKRPRAASYQSARQAAELGEELTGRIRAFAGRCLCTPFMILVAGLNILLYRHTGRSDILIGALSANRGMAGAESLIGYLVNALILRTRFSPAMSGVDLIDRVRRVCLDAYARQDVPFEYLEELLPKRGGAPLYQVMLNYRSYWAPDEEAGGLQIAPWSGQNRAPDPGIAISRLDLSLHLRETPAKISGVVHYKTDLFDRSDIAELVAFYRQILRRLVEDPSRRVSDIASR